MLEFRKYAIVESINYQNIPRTIQNVFLNSKLDADFIKDTIIRSMTEEEISIDLNFYRRQIRDFEQQYNDVMLWFTKNKNGEIPVRRQADRVIKMYRQLLFAKQEISNARRELVYAERVARESIPMLREEKKSAEDAKRKISSEIGLLDQIRATEKQRIDREIGANDKFFRELEQKRRQYEEMNIQEIVHRVAQENLVQKDLDNARERKEELTRAHHDIVSKYKSLIDRELNALNSFINNKESQKNVCRNEAMKRKDDLQKNLSADEERVRKSYDNQVAKLNECFNNLSVEKANLISEHEKIQYKEPHQKEILKNENELKLLQEREMKIDIETRDLRNELDNLQHEWQLELKKIEDKCKQNVDNEIREKDLINNELQSLENLLEQHKGSFAEWLDANVDGWEQTVGKVAVEDSILFNKELNPKLLANCDNAFFGIQIDLSSVDRKPRTVADLQAEKQKKLEQIAKIENRIKQYNNELAEATEKLKSKYSERMRSLKDRREVLQIEKETIPQKIKGVRAELLSLHNQTNQWLLEKLSEIQQRIDENIAESHRTENDKRNLSEEKENELNELRRSNSLKINEINVEVERTISKIDNEIDERNSAFKLTEQQLKDSEAAELSGKGGDMQAIKCCESEIYKLEAEMKFISENRKIVAIYENDCKVYFECEPSKQTERKELEAQLSELETKYEQRRQLLNSQLEEANRLLSQKIKQLETIENGVQDVEHFRNNESFCPSGSMDVEEKQTQRNCSELVDFLQSTIFSLNHQNEEFKRTVYDFTTNFTEKNTFSFQLELRSDDEFMAFAQDLLEFVENDKISDYKRQINGRYTDILRRISKETGNLMKNQGEIGKTINAVNEDFERRNFAGVIREITLRSVPSTDKLMQLLLEIKHFTDENQYNMGEPDLFSQSSNDEVNKSAVKFLKSFMTCLSDEPSRKQLQLADTFNLQFRIRENDNDTGWTEKISSVGSDGTDILVKAMINIMLINVFKEKASKKFGDFRLHCMMDEIGKLHPNNVEGILKFANSRNIMLVNGSPTTFNVGDYKHTYILSKDEYANTRVVPLISHI